jgi:hypothetical protein
VIEKVNGATELTINGVSVLSGVNEMRTMSRSLIITKGR